MENDIPGCLGLIMALICCNSTKEIRRDQFECDYSGVDFCHSRIQDPSMRMDSKRKKRKE